MTTLVWFRQDLRLADNPALSAACRDGDIVPVYILGDDEKRAKHEPLGGASKWWLHHSLEALSKALGGLIVRRGDPAEILPNLAENYGAATIVWNRCYEPCAIKRDKGLKLNLIDAGYTVKSFNASLLAEPWDIQTGSGGPYQVYTPFWRALRKERQSAPQRTPKVSLAGDLKNAGQDSIGELDLLPTSPNWADGWQEIWQPGEAGARDRLSAFLDDGIKGYKELRNRPDRENVSRLSPHLHFGEISPRQIWAAVTRHIDEHPGNENDAWTFLSEVAWREFSYHLLFHFPQLPQDNLKDEFDAYPWRKSKKDLSAWQNGQTGYPMVDAGMRELWQTGYMHNRVRMITASFLIKHLRLDWRHGHAWFNDTLVDADLANNSASWQWVAGSGADAAPYFRIFNPILQGEKFDPNGDYVRRWVPELSNLDAKHIHHPFDAPETALAKAGVKLGTNYPHPIVDHNEARKAALSGYDKVKAAKADAA